jgi:hypothetical protein
MTTQLTDNRGRGAPVVAAPEARRLAAVWARDLEARAEQMLDFLAAHIGELREDAATAEITLAACSGNLQVLLSMIRHGISADRTEAPLASLEHARHMAARGAGIDVTLRFYRLGHAWFTEHWSAALVENVPDPARLLDGVRESIAVGFAYIDIVSSKVSAEPVAERDRRQRRATAVRAEAVRGLLAGEPCFTLAGPVLAFICWNAADPAPLEQAVRALTAHLGTTRRCSSPRRRTNWQDGPTPMAAVSRAQRRC